MKISRIVLLLALFSANAFAADCFSLASGYTPEKFNVSIKGAEGGLVEAVIPLLVAIGAKSETTTDCRACPYTTYALPDDSQFIMVRTPAKGIPGYQWNFKLAYSDGVQVNTAGSGLRFIGPVAEALYLGLDSTQATQVGMTAGADGVFNIPIYSKSGAGYAITCRKQLAKTDCSLSLEASCKI